MKNKIFILLGGIFLFTVLLGAGCSKDQQQNKKSSDDAVSADDDSTIAEEADDVSENSDDVSDGEVVSGDEWQIYDGDGFTLRYPENWRVSELGGLYRIPEGEEEDFQIPEEFDYGVRERLVTIFPMVEDNVDNIDLEKFWSETNVDGSIKERLIIGEEPAFTASCGGISYSECVLALHKNKKINIVIDYMVDNGFVREEVRQILSTFQFTE